MLTFGNPWALVLFALLPLFWIISRGKLVYFAPWRRRIAVGLRLTLLILLILALADLRLLKSSDTLSVVFLLDQSDSMPPAARAAALDFVRAAVAEKPTDDTAGVVVFGANAVVEEVPRARLNLAAIASTPDSSYTNFAAAIRLGMALFPADAAKRMVLISDGQNNLGDPLAAAQLAHAAGIELDTVNLTTAATGAPEVRLQQLSTPGTLHTGEHFNLNLTITSNTTTQTEVQIFAAGQLAAQETVNLHPGENRFLFPMVAGDTGFSSFRATLIPTADTLAQNNRRDTFSLIEGPLQVLVVARTPADTANLAPALTAADLNPQVVSPAEMPATPLALSEYAAVVLVNIPATALSPTQLNLLQVYVRDLGKGLIVVGGAESYGAGGYFQTPLEETLPVEMTLKDRERLPGMSMLMVIDKSGSMDAAGTMNMGGPKKVELAKEAIYRAVDFLAPWDRVGVIAFDTAARWVVRPEPVVDVSGIKNRVGTIRASGGTDILAGLELAADAIEKEPSRVRHIILLTDGGANPAGIPELVDKLAAQDISVSVVAIGDDAAPFLKDVAKRGNGRFHLARDPATIPQIFAQEATLALKAYLIEEPFTPKLTAASPILQGIAALPPLQGYVATTPKLTAQTVLASAQDDPVLAQWQYGLGRAVAWTSDATGRWARDWVQWDGFARFWGQAMRWTIVEAGGGNLEMQIVRDSVRGVMRLTVDALDAHGNSLNDLTLMGSVLSPGLENTEITLEQVAPGRYQTEFSPTETGAYLLRLLATAPNGQLAGSATRGFVVSYSPEYAAPTAAPTLLANLADLGGGAELAPSVAATVFAHTLPPVSGSRPLWQLLLAAFALLLPLDVGVRRVAIGREDWLKLAHRLRKWLPAAPGKTASPAPKPSSAKGLLSIKKKMQAENGGQRATVSPQRSALSAQPPQPEPPHPKPETRDRLGRLLDAKRKAGKK